MSLSMKARGITLAALFALALVVTALWIAYQVYQPYQAYPGDETFVVIPRGAAPAAIGETLEANGVVRSAYVFRWYVRVLQPSRSLKAGEYRFDRPMSVAEVAEKIQEGRVYYLRFTVPEGRDLFEVTSQLVQQGFGTAEGFQAAFRRTEWIEDLDPAATDLEGYLFPSTYFVQRHTSESEVVRQMIDAFKRNWTPEHQERARELNMSVRDVITMASLVEKEARIPDERPLISAVFHNRLRLNMRLGCDPTVVYAAKLAGRWNGVINMSDLRYESPYNTYLVTGLPPGPIASPGLRSIHAALHPVESDYLYFVSRNDGSHVFSRNYADHRRAVNQYQR
jgi:UPF0755 protein